jgi:hypothetical protein
MSYDCLGFLYHFVPMPQVQLKFYYYCNVVVIVIIFYRIHLGDQRGNLSILKSNTFLIW